MINRNAFFLSLMFCVILVAGCEKSTQSHAQAVDIPYYPGAKVDDTSEVYDEDEHGNPTQYFTQVTLITPNAFEKVKEFYQTHLPKNAVKLLETKEEYLQWQWQDGKVQKRVELNGWKSYQGFPEETRPIKSGTLINLVQSK